MVYPIALASLLLVFVDLYRRKVIPKGWVVARGAYWTTLSLFLTAQALAWWLMLTAA